MLIYIHVCIFFVLFVFHLQLDVGYIYEEQGKPFTVWFCFILIMFLNRFNIFILHPLYHVQVMQ